MKMITNITQDNFKVLARIRQSFIWVNGTVSSHHGSRGWFPSTLP